MISVAADRIQLNIIQHFRFHPVQILQQGLAIEKHEILCQRANAVIKSFVAMLEVQLHIPGVPTILVS